MIRIIETYFPIQTLNHKKIVEFSRNLIAQLLSFLHIHAEHFYTHSFLHQQLRLILIFILAYRLISKKFSGLSSRIINYNFHIFIFHFFRGREKKSIKLSGCTGLVIYYFDAIKKLRNEFAMKRKKVFHKKYHEKFI